MELARKTIKGACLFHGVQVGALQVFNDGDLHCLFVRNLAEVGRNCGLSGKLGSTPAALACDELKAAVGQRANQHGLHDAVGGNGGSQFRQLLFVDLGARLERIGINLIERNLAGLAALWLCE